MFATMLTAFGLGGASFNGEIAFKINAFTLEEFLLGNLEESIQYFFGGLGAVDFTFFVDLLGDLGYS